MASKGKRKPEYDKRRRRENYMRAVSPHGTKGRTVGIEEVNDASGISITDKAEANKYLAKYWGGIFAEIPIDLDGANDLTKQL